LAFQDSNIHPLFSVLKRASGSKHKKSEDMCDEPSVPKWNATGSRVGAVAGQARVARPIAPARRGRMRLFDQVDSGSVDKRELQLAVFSLAIIAVLVAGLAVVMYPTLESHPIIFSATTLRVSFFGFCGLSVLLLGYLLDRQVTVRRLRREIARAEEKYRELHRQVGKDLLHTLPGMSHFQDRLTMEFRRAVNTRDALSIMVIRLTPNPDVTVPSDVIATLGDAAKAILRKLRREDSLYHFKEGAFGVILPGVTVQNARMVGTRITEGLQDVSGVVARFAHDVKIFNYPQHAATASELEKAVRSLLPEMMTEPSLEETFEGSKTGASTIEGLTN
jgi:GGDEF domain-containing protein